MYNKKFLQSLFLKIICGRHNKQLLIPYSSISQQTFLLNHHNTLERECHSDCILEKAWGIKQLFHVVYTIPNFNPTLSHANIGHALTCDRIGSIFDFKAFFFIIPNSKVPLKLNNDVFISKQKVYQDLLLRTVHFLKVLKRCTVLPTT